MRFFFFLSLTCKACALSDNGISLTRLIELAKVTPGGVEDMRSQQWHDLAAHYGECTAPFASSFEASNKQALHQ